MKGVATGGRELKRVSRISIERVRVCTVESSLSPRFNNFQRKGNECWLVRIEATRVSVARMEEFEIM